MVKLTGEWIAEVLDVRHFVKLLILLLEIRGESRSRLLADVVRTAVAEGLTFSPTLRYLNLSFAGGL